VLVGGVRLEVLSCACVCRCRGCFLCRCVLCACDLLIVLQESMSAVAAPVTTVTAAVAMGAETLAVLEANPTCFSLTGGGDDDLDYYASLRRCSLCVRVSGVFCCLCVCV